jgi:hypothetical protein
MNPHARSAMAIVVTLGFLAISWFVGHRLADWEYVFLMFVVFSSALQDAMDGMNYRLEKITRIVVNSANQIDRLNRELRREIQQEARNLTREVQQESEYLKSHIKAQADLITYDIKLGTAIEKGEPLPEEPAYPEPKLVESTFVELEPPELETFDRQRFIEERVLAVADALRDHGWWDMSVVTTPLRRLYGYVSSRPAYIRWVSNDRV